MDRRENNNVNSPLLTRGQSNASPKNSPLLNPNQQDKMFPSLKVKIQQQNIKRSSSNNSPIHQRNASNSVQIQQSQFQNEEINSAKNNSPTNNNMNSNNGIRQASPKNQNGGSSQLIQNKNSFNSNNKNSNDSNGNNANSSGNINNRPIGALANYNSYVPYDKMLQGLEEEDILDSDIDVVFQRVIDKQYHVRYTQMARVVKSDQEYQQLLDHIQMYQSIKHEGLISIKKWSCELFLDKNMKRSHKFLIIFDGIGDRLDQRYPNNGKTSMLSGFKNDDFRNFVNIIQAIQYLHSNKDPNFQIAPLHPCNFAFSYDNTFKFIPQPFLQTTKTRERSKQYESLYSPPEVLKNFKFCNQEKAAIYSIGINLMLMLTNDIKKDINSNFNEVQRLLEFIKKRYCLDLKNVLEKMVSYDPNDRLNFQQIIAFIRKQSIYTSIETIVADSFSNSDDYEFFANSGFIQIPQPKQKYIATVFPYTKRLVQSNLFDEKRIFIEQLDLDTDILIPDDCSIISGDNYEVWLVGGKQNNSLFQLNDEVPTLTPLANIPCQYQRHSFGVCNVQSQYLFLVSGFIDSDPRLTNRMDRYDVAANEWKQMESCLLPANGCTLVTFNNNTLYKFGGKNEEGQIIDQLEKYDIQNNKWEIQSFRVQKGFEDIPFYKCLGIQINPCQILILGGFLFNKETKNREPNYNFYFINIDEKAMNIDKQRKQTYVEFSKASKIFFPKQKAKDQEDDSQNKYDYNYIKHKQQQLREIQVDCLVLALNNIWFVQAKNKLSKVLYRYNHQQNVQEYKKINY